MSNFYRCCKKASGTKSASISSNGVHLISGLTDYDKVSVDVSVPNVQFPNTLTLPAGGQAYISTSGTIYGGDITTQITIPKFLCDNYSTFVVAGSGATLTAGSSSIRASTTYSISSYVASNGTLLIKGRFGGSGAPVVSGSFTVTLSK